uniref:Ion transport domain-containing protein n=1 Tax=Knipowitschia caucasica TaxID=637954 RepID=A0AAV2J7K9_KNICA
MDDQPIAEEILLQEEKPCPVRTDGLSHDVTLTWAFLPMDTFMEVPQTDRGDPKGALSTASRAMDTFTEVPQRRADGSACGYREEELGKIRLLKHMLNREFEDKESRPLSRKFTEWVYEPVHSSLYDTSSIDTDEEHSVLEIIVFGSQIPNRIEMLQLEPLRSLLKDKWERFASKLFLFNFVVYMVYLSIFTAVSVNRNVGLFTIGMGNLGSVLTIEPAFGFLLILYIVLTYILMLNMLIAVMGNTVAEISSESENIWNLQVHP